jgi:hypothetical protein
VEDILSPLLKHQSTFQLPRKFKIFCDSEVYTKVDNQVIYYDSSAFYQLGAVHMSRTSYTRKNAQVNCYKSANKLLQQLGTSGAKTTC